MLTTLLAFIATIGVIVTIHEYGHFQVARWCGVKVLRFSIGFGKPLLSRKIGADQTEFVLAAIPLGGYVKMLDERELKAERDLRAEQGVNQPDEEQYSEADLARAFNRQSVYKRIAVVLAGPLANLLLAILLYWFLFMQGVTGMRPIIGEVAPNSIAAQANMTEGEVIATINNKKMNTWMEVNQALFEAAVDDKVVEVKARSHRNELHLHQLDLVGLGHDAEGNMLEKVGLSVFTPDIAPVLAKILTNSAAEKAGLQTGDMVLDIDGLQVATWNEVVNVIKASPGQPLRFTVMRNQEKIKTTVTPEKIQENKLEFGRIGVAVKINEAQREENRITMHYSRLDSLGLAIAKTWKTSAFSLKMMWYMVTGKTSWRGVSGPVTIASYAGETASLGMKPFLNFIALVSISIGILNLLPIPVLDGGHLMYYMAEIIKGSAVTEQTMMLGQKLGFGLLGLLMILAIFNDINRIVTG